MGVIWKCRPNGARTGLITEELNGPSMAKKETCIRTSHLSHDGQFFTHRQQQQQSNYGKAGGRRNTRGSSLKFVGCGTSTKPCLSRRGESGVSD